MIIEKNCKSIKDILNNDIQVNGIIYSPIFGDLELLLSGKTFSNKIN